jgi:hypothetical protein
MAKTKNPCMKTQRMGNLSPAHVISSHGSNVRQSGAGS